LTTTKINSLPQEVLGNPEMKNIDIMLESFLDKKCYEALKHPIF